MITIIHIQKYFTSMRCYIACAWCFNFDHNKFSENLALPSWKDCIFIAKYLMKTLNLNLFSVVYLYSAVYSRGPNK